MNHACNQGNWVAGKRGAHAHKAGLHGLFFPAAKSAEGWVMKLGLGGWLLELCRLEMGDVYLLDGSFWSASCYQEVMELN